MGRIIRRTITITISESWTVVWTDDDLPATSGKSNITFLPQMEQENVPQDTEVPTQPFAARPETPAESGADGDDDREHESGCLPAGQARSRAASNGSTP